MVFNKAIPGLKVLDMASSLDFYQVKLGFDCIYQSEAFARLCINDVELHLWAPPSNKGKDVQSGDGQLRKDNSTIVDAYCRVQVSDLHALYKAYQVTGAVNAATTKIARQPWGQNDFTVLDLYGNAIVFYEEAG